MDISRLLPQEVEPDEKEPEEGQQEVLIVRSKRDASLSITSSVTMRRGLSPRGRRKSQPNSGEYTVAGSLDLRVQICEAAV